MVWGVPRAIPNVTVLTELKDSAPALVVKLVQSFPGQAPTKEGAPVIGPRLWLYEYPDKDGSLRSTRSPSLKCARPMVWPAESRNTACVSVIVPDPTPVIEKVVDVPLG